MPTEQTAPRRTVGIGIAWINLWVLWVGWPALFAGGLPAGEIAFSCMSLALMALGARLLRAEPARNTQPGAGSGTDGGPDTPHDTNWLTAGPRLGLATLLIGVPTTLSAAVATRPEAVNQHVFDPIALVLAALSLSLYGASVLIYGRFLWLRDVGVGIPLTNRPWLTRPSVYDRARTTATLAVMLGGAIAIGIVAPRVGGLESLQKAWGSAAHEGGLLTSVLAGAVGVAIVGLSLTEAMRPPTAPNTYSARAIPRSVAFLVLAALGTITYWMIGSH